MPIGMVSGVGRGMDVLVWGGDRRRGRAVLGMNLGRPIVTNGDFVMRLFPNYFGQVLFIVSHHRSVCFVYCGKTADLIWMPFGVVGRLGPRMRQGDRVEIASQEGAILAMNVGHPILTNGDFVV